MPAPSSALWSAGLVGALVSQFLSALADNALIFAALAVIHRQSYPPWAGPLLQDFFIVTYVVLAPFVGEFADAQPKGRAMLWANAVKLVGTLAMIGHVNPFLSYAVVGAGAAAFSPAKYGIVAELVPSALLVRANGAIETATIAAILLGAVAGGALTDRSVEGALMAVAGCYGASLLASMLVPKLKPAKLNANFSFTTRIKTFASQTTAFVRAADLRAALIGTGIFWGSGAALRFLLIAWVPVQLRINGTAVPGYLTGMVAAGVAAGALLAGRFIRLENASKAVPAGVMLGLCVTLLPLVHALPAAFVLMAAVGLCSGFFVVPLDALLQQRGRSHGGIGATIAIQNLFENLCMLGLLSVYTVITYAKVHVNAIAVGIGLLIAGAMASVIPMMRRRPPA